MERVYTTIQGDMWDAISYKVYGDEKYMGLLMQANQELLDIFIFGAGTILIVPEQKEEVISDVPLWRQ